MDEKQIRQRLEMALELFYEKDMPLVNVKAAERALTHKLAEHLQKLFPDYDVDCEYNKIKNGDPKKVRMLMKKHTECKQGCDNCAAGKCVIYPDIIVHHREEGKDNLLVIEAKTDWSKENACRDGEKLDALTGDADYHYQLGVSFRFCSTLEETLRSFVLYPKKEG